MAQYSKRGRNANRRRQGGNNNPNRSMDSQGPDVKIRGTAAQIYEQYQALGRDAASAGDRVRAESLMQHAEHYFRLMKSMQPADKTSEGQRDDGDIGSDSQGGDDFATETTEVVSETPVREEADSGAEAPDDREEAAAAEASDEAKSRRRRRRRRPTEDESGGEAKGGSSKSGRANAVPETAAAE